MVKNTACLNEAPAKSGRLVAGLELPQVVFAVEIGPCLHGHHAGEREEADEVGDGHQAVEGIRHIPHKLQRGHAADYHHDDEHHLEHMDALVAEEILDADISTMPCTKWITSYIELT